MARAKRGRGEGGIYQRSDGLWVGSISLGYDGNGKRIRRVKYGHTKREVQDKLDELRAKAGATRNGDGGRLTLREFLLHWLENVVRPKAQSATYERYKSLADVHVIPALGGVRLDAIGTAHVEQFYATLERQAASAWTRKMAGTLLGNALRHAVRRRHIEQNPVSEVTKPKPADKEMLFLTEPQARRLLKASEGLRLRGLFYLALGGGLRQGELLALNWSAIDFIRGAVTVARSLAQVSNGFVLKEPKSKSSRRTVRLAEPVMHALRDHRTRMQKEEHGSDIVFCTKTGNHIGKSSLIRQVFRPLIRRANDAEAEVAAKEQREPELIPAALRFHDLRHSHATLLLSQGHSVKAVSQRLGHKDVAITLRTYAHVLPADDEKLAVAIGRLLA